jgi:hypothetical protein
MIQLQFWLIHQGFEPASCTLIEVEEPAELLVGLELGVKMEDVLGKP